MGAVTEGAIVRDCKDCSKRFVLSDGAVAFYIQKGLALPLRCWDCRQARKAAWAADSAGA